ncbi:MULTISPECIES: ATP-binding cassette domain-containing protein [unclassified Clostridium]|jgi:nitrate ABC transporter ATP binding protein|uniref:ATP-binding cassette domain-containing protein n=1 Tax=unclassified Clostridium TaxID=2614128 RepID=UPI0025C21904|nr:ATP-binding cassette domain-containing protein [Clostridium sp.]MCI6693869.1 ATP-binding cassette domain-containing protein [Clostridium sp.]MDY2631465.1 ATP-binding cassette domain-containing protein [Clostridium sp.]MDY4253579.1 ATP-binding cassette domain-containing protein [Clostridium sp.]MDY6227965.1 ATP-binding cassette domain-containing protein [Clostridium sp.]
MDIVIENLKKRYNDKVVLNNFNYTFKDKTISFIMGASGVGKTTLIKILMGLVQADDGKVIGINNKKISVVFQEDSLCENLSVLLNIKLVCENISNLEIEKSLELLDLKDCMHKRVRELSGGMKRRIAIIRALLYDFDLLIMDEPFKGLDKETKIKVMDFVISKLENKSAIIITHDMDEIMYFKKFRQLKINYITDLGMV